MTVTSYPLWGMMRRLADTSSYFSQSATKRAYRLVSASAVANASRWWKYACEKIRDSRRKRDGKCARDA
jgi:hypothetical protein